MKELIYRKFRAWVMSDDGIECYMHDDKKTKICGNGIFLADSNIYPEIRFIFYPAKKGSIEIEQFTGLKDKNDKDVYECDIIQLIVEKSDYYPEQSMPLVPENKETKRWNEKEIRVVSMSPEIRFGHEFVTKYCSYEFVILGNIHENPELLKP